MEAHSEGPVNAFLLAQVGYLPTCSSTCTLTHLREHFRTCAGTCASICAPAQVLAHVCTCAIAYLRILAYLRTCASKVLTHLRKYMLTCVLEKSSLAVGKMNKTAAWLLTCTLLHFRGFVKLTKIQQSEKNSEVGGWVKTQLGFQFFLEILCFFVFFMFPI